MSLSCTEYSEKAIVVRGDAKEYKEELKKLGGKYNANLKDGGGWIFSKKSEDKVLSFINSTKVVGTKIKTKIIQDEKYNYSSIDNILQELELLIINISMKERLSLIKKISCIVCSLA